MMLRGGRVRDVAAELNESPGEFLLDCIARFRSLNGAEPKVEEQESWGKSWPALLDVLVRAGLGELWIGLEYVLPGSGQRVDALLLGAARNGRLVAVVVELKQWSAVELLPGDQLRVRAHGRVLPHPSRQAGGYVRYLTTWLPVDELRLEVRAFALLHNAPPEMVDDLARMAAGWSRSPAVSLLGRDDMSLAAGALSDRLWCADLLGPSDERVRAFLDVPHAPAPALFDELAEVLNGDSAFCLVGAQQEAQLHVLGAISEALDTGRRTVVVVEGGPGTGKTVIAARLVADVPRSFAKFRCAARYLTPSGALRSHLERAATDRGTKGLFVNVRTYLQSSRSAVPEVLLVDEAQRIGRRDNTVARLLRRTNVVAFFLDERQIVRPNEGVTRAELYAAAEAVGAQAVPVRLEQQFRCGGSQRFLNWVSSLLAPSGVVPRWLPDRGADGYDVAVSRSPMDMQRWVARCVAGGQRARMTAGFCWDWGSPGPSGQLPMDVSFPWTDRDTGVRVEWSAPWNARREVHDESGRRVAPASTYWATDEGGDQQVGCVYTAQGLEYPFAGVIMGPDLVRRGDRWVAHPECSRDPVMEGVSVGDYLRFALNIYWVLLTRGSLGCRVLSTDVETQEFLAGVLPQARVVDAVGAGVTSD